MKTRMTELLGIEYPIMMAGMSWLADDPKMVAAVSNAGGLGLLATAQFTPDRTKEAIGEVRALTDKPFGANVTLQFAYARENAEACLEEKVPVINWSLGVADWIIKAAHEYGGKALGTVVMAKHALRAERDGADGLIVTGHEAAAHGGDVTSLVLIPAIANRVKIPVIAAGGFCDGRSLVAALALGAEGISLGTRFCLTKESPLHPNTIDLCLKATEEDTLYTDKLDGMGNRVLKNRTAEILVQERLSLIKSVRSARDLKRVLGVSYPKLGIDVLKTRNIQKMARQAIGANSLRRAMVDGDDKKGIMAIGQAVGRMDALPTCKEVIEGIVAEAEAIIEATREKVLAQG
jgi:enoyl-[acyl-carrier protein] reductase II